MQVARKWLIILFLGMTSFLGLLAISHPPASATYVAHDTTTQELNPGAAAEGQQPNLPDVGSEGYPPLDPQMEAFLRLFGATGPVGALSWGGYLIARTWKEGKAIAVDGYKERALAAEQRSVEAEKRANEAEAKLQEVREVARRAQTVSEEDKANYHENLMKLQFKARERTDLLHDNLDTALIQIHKLEKLLINKGIPLPEFDEEACPPGEAKNLSRTESAEALDTGEIDEI